MIRFFGATIVGVSGWLWAMAATAHQQEISYSELLFNTRSGYLEISHRFNLHSLSHAYAALGYTNSVEQPFSFSEYVVANFAIMDANGNELPLAFIGYELEGKHLWVYQHTNLAAWQQLTVAMQVLQSVWPSFVNFINVKRGGAVQSIRLTRDYAQHVFTFPVAKSH